ncbi:unnamed protein product, partial [Brenthis ino]
MTRITILSYLLVVGFLSVKAQERETDLFKNIFEKDVEMKCSSVEGKERGCLDCYICDGDAAKRQISRPKALHKIKLYNNECESKEFCCFSQQDVTARNTDHCGKSEPDGYPRNTRKKLRSVLQGQYPWRIWIFCIDSTEPICAGVYIHHGKRAVMTSATCVDNYVSQELRVGFTRHHGNIRVGNDSFIVHDDYNRETGINDIAILGLSQEDALSPWAHPACLPTSSPLFATPCIAVSEQDYYLNAVIPRQSNCVIGGKPLEETRLCAVSPKNDYIPEVGGGLFCEQETSMNNINYVVNGIYLSKHNSLSVYTNISHYIKWIDETIEDLKI